MSNFITLAGGQNRECRYAAFVGGRGSGRESSYDQEKFDGNGIQGKKEGYSPPAMGKSWNGKKYATWKK